MRYKKVYIEITNSCNFSCSFCFKTARQKLFMTVDQFSYIITKLKPYTKYIYLHVLGEPLMHPQFNEILSVAAEAQIYVNITTNGSLLHKINHDFKIHPIRQINISLHDAEENLNPESIMLYLNKIIVFSRLASASMYISFRLWNVTNSSSSEFNKLCIEVLEREFGVNLSDEIKEEQRQNIKLAEHIYLHFAPRFIWPGEHFEDSTLKKSCYALRDHFAILSNGDVVPCCLDADAAMSLGNIFSNELDEMLSTEKALNIKRGFEQHKAVEPFCASCGFSF